MRSRVVLSWCLLLPFVFLVVIEATKAQPNQDDLLSATRLAFASYCDPDALQSWSCYWCNQTGRVEDAETIYDATLNAFGFVGRWPDRLWMVFRGTELLSFTNWFKNIDFTQISPYPDRTEIRVHKGFYSTYSSIKSQMLDAVRSQATRCPRCPLYVVGHSLGGAMATFAAIDLVRSGNFTGREIRLVTLGSPRVGDVRFSRYASALGIKSWRLVQDRDIVPHIPPAWVNYNHVSQEDWWTGGSWHTCNPDPSNEDPSCSDSIDLFQCTINDHAVYDGLNLFDGIPHRCYKLLPPRERAALMRAQERLQVTLTRRVE